MNQIYQIPVEEILRALLVFIRVGAIIFALPLFGDSPVPVRVRIVLSVAFTTCLYPLVDAMWLSRVPDDILQLGSLVIREVIIGFVIGYLSRLTFDALLMAASFVGYQMGFGTANLFVPDAGEQLNGFTAFHRIVILLFFLTMDFHHGYLVSILKTFEHIDAGAASLSTDFRSIFVSTTANLFLVSLQLASPILVALMFAMTALGLVARTVPQMNVFTLSFPFSFFIGLLVYLATMPLFPSYLNDHFLAAEKLLEDALVGLGVSHG